MQIGGTVEHEGDNYTVIDVDTDKIEDKILVSITLKKEESA